MFYGNETNSKSVSVNLKIIIEKPLIFNQLENVYYIPINERVFLFDVMAWDEIVKYNIAEIWVSHVGIMQESNN